MTLRELVLETDGGAFRALEVGDPTARPALHGAVDGCVLARGEADHSRFAGPYAREILPGLGHFLHIEGPELVAARVAQWLA